MSEPKQEQQQDAGARKRSRRIGWHVVELPSGAFQGRAWDPNEHRKRCKSFATEAAAAKWAKHEHSLMATRQAQAGTKPIDPLITDYIDDKGRTCSSAEHVKEIKRILLAAAASGVDDMRSDRATAQATRFLAAVRALRGPDDSDEKAELAARTLNRYLNTLRAFGNWCVKRRHIIHNPFTALEAVATPDDLKATFALDELAKLCDPKRADHRYHRAFLLQAYCGLREGEAMNARWSWFLWSEGMLRVTRRAGWKLKRQKERLVPIPPELAAAFKPLADDAQVKGERDALVAASAAGGTRKTRQRRFESYLTHCGVPVGDRTPHSSRHTWISIMLATGEPEVLVQLYAGHEKLETTSEYARSMVQYRRAVSAWERGEIRYRLAA